MWILIEVYHKMLATQDVKRIMISNTIVLIYYICFKVDDAEQSQINKSWGLILKS